MCPSETEVALIFFRFVEMEIEVVVKSMPVLSLGGNR